MPIIASSTVPLSDFQVDFDGLIMGPGTPYGITLMGGFLDMAGVRANYTPRARAHGGYTEPHYADGATYDLEMDVTATASTSFADAVAALQSGTYPQQTTRLLRFKMPGQDVRLMNVQCVRRSIPVEQAFTFGMANKAALQFYAPDPLKYGEQLYDTTGLATSSGGLTYPLTYPLNYGSAGNLGRITATNPGSADASLILTVSGPIDAQGFSVTTIEDGVTLTYNAALGANDTVVIDTRVGSVILNGTADRRALLSYSQWPVIPANSTRTIQFSALGSYQPAASLQAAWSPAFW